MGVPTPQKSWLFQIYNSIALWLGGSLAWRNPEERYLICKSAKQLPEPAGVSVPGFHPKSRIHLNRS